MNARHCWQFAWNKNVFLASTMPEVLGHFKFESINTKVEAKFLIELDLQHDIIISP